MFRKDTRGDLAVEAHNLWLFHFTYGYHHRLFFATMARSTHCLGGQQVFKRIVCSCQSLSSTGHVHDNSSLETSSHLFSARPTTPRISSGPKTVPPAFSIPLTLVSPSLLSTTTVTLS